MGTASTLSQFAWYGSYYNGYRTIFVALAYDITIFLALAYEIVYSTQHIHVTPHPVWLPALPRHLKSSPPTREAQPAAQEDKESDSCDRRPRLELPCDKRYSIFCEINVLSLMKVILLDLTYCISSGVYCATVYKKVTRMGLWKQASRQSPMMEKLSQASRVEPGFPNAYFILKKMHLD